MSLKRNSSRFTRSTEQLSSCGPSLFSSNSDEESSNSSHNNAFLGNNTNSANNSYTGNTGSNFNNGNIGIISNRKEEDKQTVHNPIFRPRAELVEVLLATDFEVISALCEVALVPEEDRALAEALVDFFEANGKTKRLLQWAIHKEIHNSTSSSTLFRGSNEATKLMSVLYMKLGREYLKLVAGNLVKDIIASGSSFEVDPNRAEKGIHVKDNLKKLISIADEFLSNIVGSVGQCPSFFRYVFYYVRKEVNKKFPNCGTLIVGVMFFSRFLIPAIVTPTQYGLTLESPSMEAHRGLVLISKLLQNLSNAIAFDDTREEFTLELNRFISVNTRTLHNFLELLSTIREDSYRNDTKLYSLSSDAEQGALNIITNTMKTYQQKIYLLLTKPETKKIFIQVVEADLYRTNNNDSWLSSFKTPKKKILEKFQSRLADDRLEKLDKIEQQLEEEIKARKALERKVNELATLLSDQKEINESNGKALKEMQIILRTITNSTSSSNNYKNTETSTVTLTSSTTVYTNNNNNM